MNASFRRIDWIARITFLEAVRQRFFAFLLVLATTYVSKRFTHDQATRAIVVSYYWHFVDVVWIALFFMIYILR